MNAPSFDRRATGWLATLFFVLSLTACLGAADDRKDPDTNTPGTGTPGDPNNGLPGDADALADPGTVTNRFTIPAGVTGSSQTSTDRAPGFAFDGKWETTWSAAIPANGTARPWVQLNFSEAQEVTRLAPVFDRSGVWRFRVDGSLDGRTWVMLLDRTKGAAGVGFSEPARGRYRAVRLTVLASPDGNAAGLREFNVQGSPVATNLAAGKPFTASSELPAHPARLAGDANTGTYWAAAAGTYPQTLTVDLLVPRAIWSVDQSFKDVDTHRFRIEGSLDQTTWTPLLDASAGNRGQHFRRDLTGTYRYVRLVVLGSASNFWAGSNELRVLGRDDEAPDARELGRGVSAKSSSLRAGGEPFLANDGNDATAWTAEASAEPQTLTLDLGNVSQVARIEPTLPRDETWRYTLQGSLDGAEWTALDTGTSSEGVRGRAFQHDVSASLRYVRLTLTPTSAAQAVGVSELRVFGLGSPEPMRWWQERSGVMRYFPVWQRLGFKAIEAQLDTLKAQGYQAVELAPVFQGNRDVWAGLAVTNLYAVQPDLGTMQEFKELIAAAHARDIKIIFFANPGYAHTSSDMFRKAEDDFRAGRESAERSWFDLRATPGEYPDKWHFSSRANAYYWGTWDVNAPSFNFANAAWRNETKKYLRFWMDTGVDGVVLDAPSVYHRTTLSLNNEAVTDVLRNYDPFMNSEGVNGTEFVTDWHYNSLQDYSVTQWDLPPAQGNSTIINAIESQNPNGIENVLKGYRDLVVNAGGITQTPPNWGRTNYPSQKRLLEIATLTTLGTFFYIHNDYFTILPLDQEVPKWSAEHQDLLYRLVRANAGWDALAPTGLRVKLPTNDNNRFYAFKRSNASGTVKSLVVLNFQATPQTVTVDLMGSGIAPGQTPIDLIAEKPAPRIDGVSYSIPLPAYGFAILGVDVM